MRITNLHHIREAVSEMTWAITPQKLDAIIEVIELRTSDTPLSADEVKARVGDVQVRSQQRSGNVAVIPLAGTLYPRANMVTEQSGGVSVERWIAQVEAAAADPAVSAIVIDVDSPGGAAAGVPEAAARLRALRGKGKPIVAVANTLMASGAYWLAAQADSIVATPSSDVGSVGVFTVHRDMSKAYEDAGVKHTLIKAGKFKAEGVPFEPLSDEARAALQEKVDDTYTEFLSALAKGRNVSVKKVADDFGQGRVMGARAALKAGMVDAVGTLQSVVNDLAAGRGAKYLRAADGTVPVSAETMNDAALLSAAMEDLPTLVVPSAGLDTAVSASSNLAPPVAEEHHVDNTTTAAPAAAVNTPSRETQLTELAALTGNQPQLFSWISSGKSVSDVRADLLSAQSPKPAAISVGAQRETQRPWENFSAQLKAVVDHGMNISTDPRLFAAASGMSQNVPSEGGFTVAPQFSASIWDEMNSQPDALLPMTDNYTVEGESLTFNANAETSRANGSRYGGVRGYWLNEADAATSSAPKFRQARVEPQEMAVLVYLTDKLLNNSGVALQQYVTRAAADEINFLTSDAIFRGDGVGKPKGFTASGAKITVAKETSQAANTIKQENISKMWARLHPRLRSNAVWLINSDVEPALDTLSTVVKNVADTENVGGYANKVWDAERRTLKGRPVVVSEFCESLTTEGDIVLWAPKAYLTGTRGGIKEAMSMHVRFIYAEQALRFMFAVDGQTWNASAITPYKGSNTQSSVITLATR